MKEEGRSGIGLGMERSDSDLARMTRYPDNCPMSNNSCSRRLIYKLDRALLMADCVWRGHSGKSGVVAYCWHTPAGYKFFKFIFGRGEIFLTTIIWTKRQRFYH